MTGFAGKRKKYSWLPETNPSALSGDTHSPTTATSSKTDGDTTPRTTKPRQRAKPKAADKPDDPQLDGLGITTAPGLSEEPTAAASAALAAEETRAPGTATKPRRRSRKDSVDELVRSRLQSTMAGGGGGGNGRKRAGDVPTASTITASVRDALGYERPGGRTSPRPRAPPPPGKPSSSSARTPAPRRASPPPTLGPRESRYSFPAYAPLRRGHPASTMRHCMRGVGWDERGTRHVAGVAGENTIVVHPGSRWLRIGRASDPVPREIPHVIARKLSQPTPRVPGPRGQGGDAEVDGLPAHGGRPEESSDEDGGLVEGGAVDRTLDMLRDALKQHQRQSKRKVPVNVYAQVLTYNRQASFDVIQDHNDPFKIEWIAASEVSGDFEIGERALRIADASQFLIRHPLRNGCFNIEEYSGVEEVLGDIESIWTAALQQELGISRRDLAQYAVVLVVPDLFNRTEVAALANMLLRHMGFGHLLVQQSSVAVTFGAGISAACVVDVGAQTTSIACVEDGFCMPESRVRVMYGGDDMTRFLFNLFQRSAFPYKEASLARMSDWLMLNELREKYCTMNLSDVNIRLRDFFVRQPQQQQQHTRKYSFKTYDEAYHAPLCLFYPAVADELVQLPRYEDSFVPLDTAEVQDAGGLLCRYVTPTQFGLLPLRVVETPAAASVASDQPSTGVATAPATVPSTEPGTPDPQQQQPAADTTPLPSDTKPTPLLPTTAYVPDPSAQHSRMPLDLAITHSIVRSGQLERAQKMYSSILIVGGGVTFIPEFNDVLASRLMYVRPEYMKGVERADIVSAPRELDPRVLAWKGGAVLSRCETEYNMWVSAEEWADFGPRLLRDRLFFQW